MKNILFFILFFTVVSNAVVFKAKLKKSDVNLGIEQIELPNEVEKTLKSGLSNYFLLKLYVFKNGNKIDERELAITIVYDLWDEMYFVSKKWNRPCVELKEKEKENILGKLRNQYFESILKKEDLASKDIFEIKIRFVADPISKEKQKKIKSWMAENRVNVVTGSNVEVRKAASETKNDNIGSIVDSAKVSVFSKVLDSELSDDVNGTWVFETENFRIVEKDLIYEK